MDPIIKEIEVKSVLSKSNLPVSVDYFYHQQIKKPARKGGDNT